MLGLGLVVDGTQVRPLPVEVVLLRAVATMAGGYDVRCGVIAAARQRNHVVLREPLWTLAAVGAAVIPRPLDRLPLSAGQIVDRGGELSRSMTLAPYGRRLRVLLTVAAPVLGL